MSSCDSQTHTYMPKTWKHDADILNMNAHHNILGLNYFANSIQVVGHILVHDVLILASAGASAHTSWQPTSAYIQSSFEGGLWCVDIPTFC